MATEEVIRVVSNAVLRRIELSLATTETYSILIMQLPNHLSCTCEGFCFLFWVFKLECPNFVLWDLGQMG